MSELTPQIVIDTKDLTKEQWLEYRRKGIGGSDASIVMNQSPWNTPLGLYQDKIGAASEIPDDDGVPLEVGTLLEPLVAKLFAEETGYQVWKDTNMYRHPLYPFMQVNLDYRVTLSDGRNAILECKTGSVYNKDDWADGKVPLHYETQCRHEMAVMDIDIIFIACLLGNTKSGFSYTTIERDKNLEAELIQQEKDFWEYVENRNPPPLSHPNPELALKILNSYRTATTDKPVALDDGYGQILSEIRLLMDEKSLLKKQEDALDKQIKGLYLPIVEKMGDAETANCNDFTATFKKRSRTVIDSDKLKSNYPKIFQECRKETVYHTFDVKYNQQTTKQQKNIAA